MPHENKDARRRIADNVFATTNIDLSKRRAESELMPMKWPDYSFMSPLEATQRFADLYVQHKRFAMQRHIDRDKAKLVQDVVLSSGTTAPRLLAQFWGARQKADFLGARYDDYIEFSFDFATRRTRHYLPHPNQLGPSAVNEAACDAWMPLWEQLWEMRLNSYVRRPAHLPQFTLEQHAGLPAQTASRETVLRQAEAGSRDLSRLIYELCIERRCVPLRTLVPLFGRTRVLRESRRMRDITGFDRDAGKSAKPLAPSELWQSCFGLPGAREATSPVCSSCPQSEACEVIAGRVSREVSSKTGSNEPVAERKRAEQRERTRRCRARKLQQQALSLSAEESLMPVGSLCSGELL